MKESKYDNLEDGFQRIDQLGEKIVEQLDAVLALLEEIRDRLPKVG